MTLPDDKVGDKGQRYLVVARWSGITRTVGYCTETADHVEFAEAFLMHPSVDRVYVIDRRADPPTVVYGHHKGKPPIVHPAPEPR